jgi:ABC-type glycerol-3-phosphate transport system permease component
MKELITIFLFACYIMVFVFLAYLRGIAKMIAIAKNPNADTSDTPFESSYYAPIPFWSESYDSDEVKKLIRKRNWIVLWFWLSFLTPIILGFCLNNTPLQI